MKKKSKKNVIDFEEFYIHFDIEEHYISVEDFIQTIKSTEIITCNIASLILDNPKSANVYVLPPEKGSLLLTLGIIVKKTAVGIGTGIGLKFASKEVEEFVRELTGYKNGELGKNTAKILKKCVNSFMEKSTDEILSIQNGINELDTAIKAKTDFYDMCSKNKHIKGVGFTKSDTYPIKRNQFAYRMAGDIVKPIPVKEELKELIVVKPVNVDEDLQWDLKDKNTKESITAKMADENFKTLLMIGKCPQRKNSKPDVMLAKLEFHKKLENGKEKKDAYIITDVYKFNRKKIKDLPKGLKLNKIQKQNNGQLNFFEKN